MRKKLLIIMGVALAIMTAITLWTTTRAASGEPGSIQDPLVTKAYIDKRLEAIEKQLGVQPSNGNSNNSGSSGNNTTEMLSALQQYVDTKLGSLQTELKSYINTQIGSAPATGTGSTSSFKAVLVGKDKMLVGGAGAEVILRSGNALAVGNSSNEGLTNATVGKDLKSSEKVEPNHLLIIPRADGRGILAVSDCWVLIKGDYTIE